MKARLPVEYTHTSRRAREKERQSERKRLMAVFFLHAAVAARSSLGLGKRRLEQYLICIGEVIDKLSEEYDDSSAWKCIQILEDVGVNVDGWKRILRNGN